MLPRKGTKKKKRKASVAPTFRPERAVAGLAVLSALLGFGLGTSLAAGMPRVDVTFKIDANGKVLSKHDESKEKGEKGEKY